MSELNRTRHKTLAFCALSLAVVGIIGNATASDADVRLDPRMAAALQRDIDVGPAQFGRYVEKQKAAYRQTAQAEKQFGDGFGGGWFERDANGEYYFVVGATRGARQTAIDGAQIREVRYSLRQLEDAVDHFNRIAPASVKSGALSGIQYWGIDLRSNSVVIMLSPGATMRAVDMVANSPVEAGIVSFKTIPGVATAYSSSFNIFGGIPYVGSLICSVGFPVVRAVDGQKGFATAGHCGGQGATAYMNGIEIGSVFGASYPYNDYGWVGVHNTNVLYGLVYNYAGGFYPVQGSDSASLGSPICRSGYRSNVTCGHITALNVTDLYRPGGPIYNLRMSNACAGRGDSGGSWLTGNQAQGVTSGGNENPYTGTNCGMSEVVTVYQRLNPILAAYGLNLVRN
jgi:alpha-lytic endopeptidase